MEEQFVRRRDNRDVGECEDAPRGARWGVLVGFTILLSCRESI